MKDEIQYQYRFVVWSIYMIASYLSLIAQLWLIMLGHLRWSTWPFLLIWLVLWGIGSQSELKGEK